MTSSPTRVKVQKKSNGAFTPWECSKKSKRSFHAVGKRKKSQNEAFTLWECFKK